MCQPSQDGIKYSILTGVQTREVMEAFYLLYKSIMAKFKKGDIVTTLKDWEARGDKVLWPEAVVDFQDWNKVYISEWWRNLNNPIRYIVPANILYAKSNGKLTISIDEVNALMSSVMRIQNADFNNEPSLDNMKVWDTFYNDSQKYTYVWEMDWKIVRDKEWYFCIVDEEDIKKLFWTKESVCKTLFGVSYKEINII